ncbi:hypothetical protein HP397_06420 [Streptobacillus felis]|uniref:Uncharacterized protein n=1 Tax=Streptobacillus felis TaxID=1384509 RepID=A0A7Z0PFT3_9FUSO|nr:hypothetical protein [Streptobacillus felis]NYV28434.1 hypothetical protein [Streptobacillus felis]
MEFDKYDIDYLNKATDKYLVFVKNNLQTIENLYLELYNYSIPRDDSILIYGENDIVSRKIKKLENVEFLKFEQLLKRDLIYVLKSNGIYVIDKEKKQMID